MIEFINDNLNKTVVYIYSGKIIENDPYEKNWDFILNNPIPITCYVINLSPESIKWKYNGLLPYGSKQIICDKKYKSLFINALKIKINDEYYNVYFNGSKGFEILERKDYIIITLSKSNSSNDEN